MAKIKVVVEASVLALAEGATDARTGIYFLTRNLCEYLNSREDIELKFFIQGDIKLNRLLYLGYKDGPLKNCLDCSKLKPGKEKIIFIMPWVRATPNLFKLPQATVIQIVYDFATHACPELVAAPSRNLRGAVAFEKSIIQFMREPGYALCISKNTRQDLIRLTGCAAGRVDFFYPGLKQEVSVGVSNGAVAPDKVRSFLKLPPNAKYVLVLSTVEPRKNIYTSIKVFQKAAEALSGHDLYFVIVGELKYWSGALDVINALPPAIREKVRLTGYLADGYLPELYKGALCLLYPSLYEGFGMPLLEAMSCGTPVVASNRGSIPEVIGESNDVFDAFDVKGMAEKIVGWHLSPEKRSRDGALAYKRAKYFTWDKAIDRIVKFIKEKSAHHETTRHD